MLTTSILNPRDLFQKTVCYSIPTFQRPYVWNHDDQWEPLWNDVRNLAETYLEELENCENNRVKAEQRTMPHFLGAVVLQQVPTAARDIEQREVIDGQQRVTTIQLLLDAIQQICEEKGFRPVATRLSKLVINDRDLVGEGSHQIFKLWPTRSDREAFRHAMDNGLAVSDFENSLIVQAHEFFQEQLKKWLEDSVASEPDSVDALETAVTTMLQMVVIDLSADDDPNVIFETMNARGTPLEQSDLIKNYVLSRSSNELTGKTDSWEGLDDNWWRDTVRQGRLYRPRLDMLLNYWLAMRLGTDVSPSRVFSSFQRHATDQPIDRIMSRVRFDLGNYRRFENGPRRLEEELFHYRTGVMQVGVFTPVLLLLLSAEHGPRIGAFRALESFLIRRMVCRQTTKDYNRLALDLAIRLEGHGLSEADKTVTDFLKGQTAYSREWPTDATVADSLVSSPLYRLLTRGRLRLVLEGIESRLRSAKAEQQDVPKNLTIEHLMPLSWEANWALADGVDEEPAREYRNRIVHTIGNLTLVNQKLNSSLSNGPWPNKREALNDHSVMMLNSELRKECTWNEETIQTRSRRMAKLIADCWPGPTSVEWKLRRHTH